MVLSSVSVRADADWQMNASEGRFDDSLGDESTMFARVFEVFESAWRPFLELFCLKAERKASPSFVSSARGCCAPFFSRCKSRSVNPSQLVIRHTCLHSRFSSVNESTDVCISQSSMLDPLPADPLRRSGINEAVNRSSTHVHSNRRSNTVEVSEFPSTRKHAATSEADRAAVFREAATG